MADKTKEESKVPMRGGGGEAPSILPPSGLAEDVLGASSLEEKRGSGMRKTSGGGNGGDSAGAGELMKFVTFFLEKEEYALPIGQVQEINRITEITKVPNSPGHVRGVINLRGRIVPVIELKRRLKLGEARVDKDSRIVVVENGSKVLGLMVDRVAQVLNISSAQIDDTPDEVSQGEDNYIKGIGKINGRMIILLDLEKVILQDRR